MRLLRAEEFCSPQQPPLPDQDMAVPGDGEPLCYGSGIRR